MAAVFAKRVSRSMLALVSNSTPRCVGRISVSLARPREKYSISCRRPSSYSSKSSRPSSVTGTSSPSRTDTPTCTRSIRLVNSGS